MAMGQSGTRTAHIQAVSSAGSLAKGTSILRFRANRDSARSGWAEAPQSCIAQQSASSSDPALIGWVLAFVQDLPKLLTLQALSLALLRARFGVVGIGGRGCQSPGGSRARRWYPYLSLLDLHVVERGAQPSCELLRIVVAPEMHEEQARLVVEHVVVDRGHLDAVRAQRLQHRIDLVGGEHEIARDRRLAASALPGN